MVTPDKDFAQLVSENIFRQPRPGINCGVPEAAQKNAQRH
jgi:hypothetical protein